MVQSLYLFPHSILWPFNYKPDWLFPCLKFFLHCLCLKKNQHKLLSTVTQIPGERNELSLECALLETASLPSLPTGFLVTSPSVSHKCTAMADSWELLRYGLRKSQVLCKLFQHPIHTSLWVSPARHCQGFLPTTADYSQDVYYSFWCPSYSAGFV